MKALHREGKKGRGSGFLLERSIKPFCILLPRAATDFPSLRSRVYAIYHPLCLSHSPFSTPSLSAIFYLRSNLSIPLRRHCFLLFLHLWTYPDYFYLHGLPCSPCKHWANYFPSGFSDLVAGFPSSVLAHRSSSRSTPRHLLFQHGGKTSLGNLDIYRPLLILTSRRRIFSKFSSTGYYRGGS